MKDKIIAALKEYCDGPVPDWVRLDHDEYRKRRNQELETLLFELEDRSLLTQAAANFYSLGAMSESEWGSFHHQKILMAIALEALDKNIEWP